ncbi:MAG: hypothetical protein SYC29_12460, partial [Planctomycetota bacterium]|nr:hypothetical protein [Planctomycetota bacterium]
MPSSTKTRKPPAAVREKRAAMEDRATSTIEPTLAPPPPASAPPRPTASELIDPEQHYSPERIDEDLCLAPGTTWRAYQRFRAERKYFGPQGLAHARQLRGDSILRWIEGENVPARVSDSAASIYLRTRGREKREAEAAAAPAPEPAVPRNIVERAAQLRGHVDEAAAKRYVELIAAADHSDDGAAELVELMRKLGISDEKAREHASVVAELRELEPKVASIEKLDAEHSKLNAKANETRDRLRPKIEELHREIESVRRAASAASSKLQAARHAASRVGWIKRNYPELF